MIWVILCLTRPNEVCVEVLDMSFKVLGIFKHLCLTLETSVDTDYERCSLHWEYKLNTVKFDMLHCLKHNDESVPVYWQLCVYETKYFDENRMGYRYTLQYCTAWRHTLASDVIPSVGPAEIKK